MAKRDSGKRKDAAGGMLAEKLLGNRVPEALSRMACGISESNSISTTKAKSSATTTMSAK